MPDPARESLRRYVEQQLEAGIESVVLPPSSRADAGSRAGAAADTGTDPDETGPRGAGAASPEAGAADSLARVASEVAACTRCPLHATRQQAVPGVGPEDAGIVFVGEGPGAEEDRRGEPFVGRAGQLLNKILAAIGFDRRDVFITNIVKCRPPGNRDPRPEEIQACEPYLKRQLALLAPRAICALGRHAAMTLLQSKESMARLRTGERWYEGIRVFPTYHPAALLRNPQWKRPTWEDVQALRRYHDAAAGHAVDAAAAAEPAPREEAE